MITFLELSNPLNPSFLKKTQNKELNSSLCIWVCPKELHKGSFLHPSKHLPVLFPMIIFPLPIHFSLMVGMNSVVTVSLRASSDFRSMKVAARSDLDRCSTLNNESLSALWRDAVSHHCYMLIPCQLYCLAPFFSFTQMYFSNFPSPKSLSLSNWHPLSLNTIYLKKKKILRF